LGFGLSGLLGTVLTLTLGVLGTVSGDSDAADPTTGAGTGGIPAAQGGSVPHTDSLYSTIGNGRVDTLSYRLRLRWAPATRTLTGTARILLRPLDDGTFTLDLGRPLLVRSLALRTGDDQPLDSTFTHDGDLLTVRSPRMAAGTTYVVTVRYSGTPHTVRIPSSREDDANLGWDIRSDGQVSTMQEPYGAYTWYPVNDQPADKALYDVTIDVPRKWVGVSNGRMVSRVRTASRQVTHFTNRDPMSSYLTTIAIGPYVRSTQRGPHGLPITYWVPRSRTRYLAALRSTPAALRWLESKLGPYPFDRAGIVVVPGDSAMETQTMITMGRGNYGFGQQNVRETVVHEMAHAWYGDTVTPNDWSDVWMSEGMAMFLESRYSIYRGWHTAAEWRKELTGHDGLWRRLYGPPGAPDRNQFAQINVYYCPSRMWLRLRSEIGARKFDELVRRWPQEHRDSSQDRASYTAWYGRESGKGWEWFKPWLLSPTAPQ
jgi:aminopeptidase N